MKRFVPKRLEPIAFGFLLSGMMSFIVASLSTTLALGGIDISASIAAWLSSWIVAFPAVLIVAPIVRRILTQIVKTD